jgi:hypothetical protein
MSYVERNLVSGETLLYRTRHHWLVLFGPVVGGLVLLIPGVALLIEAIALRETNGLAIGSSTVSLETMAILGAI